MSSTTPLNFAPYADPPDRSRPSLSSWSTPAAAPTSDPPPAAPSTTSSSYHSGAPISSLSQGTSYSSSSPSTSYGNLGSGYAPVGTSGGGLLSGYETTTLRHDWAGPLCYAFGPLGAAVLLVLEVENDWVRFQAWQSVLLSAALVLLHLLWAALFGGRFFQYLFLLLDIAALTLMSLRAYHDSDHLDRHRLPLIGELADQFVRNE